LAIDDHPTCDCPKNAILYLVGVYGGVDCVFAYCAEMWGLRVPSTSAVGIESHVDAASRAFRDIHGLTVETVDVSEYDGVMIQENTPGEIIDPSLVVNKIAIDYDFKSVAGAVVVEGTKGAWVPIDTMLSAENLPTKTFDDLRKIQTYLKKKRSKISQ
jgi:hypothetical protein